MDSMLMVHAAKWIFAEFLRLAWKKDKAVIAETIAGIVQLEYTLIHELDGKPLILDQNVSGPEELLLLLNHADNHRLPKDVLLAHAKNNTPSSLATALSRLLCVNEVRPEARDREDNSEVVEIDHHDRQRSSEGIGARRDS